MDFKTLQDQIRNCNRCKEKFGFYPKPIVNEYKGAKIFHVSQAPSKTVHETGRSFNDKSGEKLKYEWYGITDADFYDPKKFFITSLGHCYPGKSKNKGDNLPPKQCLPWLEKEIELIDCKLYIVVGALAAKYFFPNEKFQDLVYKDNYYNGKLTYVLPHPSPLNSKWFKDNPDFFNKRLPIIRKTIHDIID